MLFFRGLGQCPVPCPPAGSRISRPAGEISEFSGRGRPPVPAGAGAGQNVMSIMVPLLLTLKVAGIATLGEFIFGMLPAARCHLPAHPGNVLARRM